MLITPFLLGACGKESLPEGDSGDTQPQIELADCTSDLPEIPWGDNKPVEANSGIPAALDELDFSLLADPIDVTGLPSLYLGFVAYALEIPPEDIGTSLSHEQILQAGDLGRVVLGAFLKGENDALGIDFSFFRRGFYHYYTCSRDFPLTLEGFRSKYGEIDMTNGVVVDSMAKCGDRNLATDATAGVYVAETLVDGIVRETEILLTGQRSDGNPDFLVYDEEGFLTTRSQFPTIQNGDPVVAASPYVCMSCHFNSERTEHAVGFDVLMPEFGPCQ